jgi:hypothetical protein
VALCLLLTDAVASLAVKSYMSNVIYSANKQ